ncbi:MAG: phosphoglycolate phosphatase [Rhodospirillales bacterium]|nr:phosphoglycolate phosphatase [Rhodospirillales bacterium]
MRHKSILFDLDGTLIDSLPDLAHALNRLLADKGLAPLELAAVRLMVGDGARKLVERAFAAAGNPQPHDIEQQHARFLELYEEGPAQRTAIYPGVVETLTELKSLGLKLGLVTNKPQAATEMILDSLRLSPLFDAVVGARAGLALKPDPAPLRQALEDMGAQSGQALMVGDNANDVQAAKALCIPVVAVTYGYSRIDPAHLGADILIERFSDLTTALRWFPG